jgi:hypothetical protein
MASLTFYSKRETLTIKIDKAQGIWLTTILPELSVNNVKTLTLQDVKESYAKAGLEDFELFWDNKPINSLYKFGLLHL